MDLRLRPLHPEDAGQALAAQAELDAEGHRFLLGFNRARSWDAYLAQLERERRGEVRAEHVAATFLVGVVGERIAGRVSIRHALNDDLRRFGGHIGYTVRPADRGRGIATEMLRQALAVTRALGIERALLTCEEHNAASIAVIERCGGVLQDRIEGPVRGRQTRRYWIA